MLKITNVFLFCLIIVQSVNAYNLYKGNNLHESYVLALEQSVVKEKEIDKFMSKNITLVNGNILTLGRYYQLSFTHWVDDEIFERKFLSLSSGEFAYTIEEKFEVTEEDVKIYAKLYPDFKILVINNDLVGAESLILNSSLLKFI